MEGVSLSLVLNTKKEISNRQVARDCNLNQKTFWYRMIRIGKNMENRQNNLLRGILEMDETYIGGNPGKNNELNAIEKKEIP